MFHTLNVTFSIPVFPVVELLRLNLFSQNFTFVTDHNKGRLITFVFVTIIYHRVNTLKKLLSTPTSYGVEIDIRSYNEELIIHHDPFTEGLLFKTWLENYNHKFLVVNIKEEGLEEQIFQCLPLFSII